MRLPSTYPKIRDVYTPCWVASGARVCRKKEAATNYSIVAFGVHENLGQLDVHNKVFRVLQRMISLVKSKRAVGVLQAKSV